MGDLGGLILLLLPLAAASGWFIARQTRRPEDQEAPGLSPDYVRGISHLVNNDTDQAIEVFIGLIEADEGTMDLHLALGSLFRRRGEVDRALRIHQNLVKRPQLRPVHRNQARFELAKDYLAAGVLDRAEEIFLELAHQGMFLQDCLHRLMRLYEREREWDKAIDTARWLASAEGRDHGVVIAQYFCEKADAAARRNDARGRLHFLNKALGEDRYCVRALMTKAQLEMDAGQWRRALKPYRDIVAHHPEFVSEIIKPWRQCVLNLHDTAHWFEDVRKAYARHPEPHLQVEMLRAAGPMAQMDPDLRASLLDELRTRPTWLGLHAVLSQPWPGLDASLQAALQALAQTLESPLEHGDQYRCVQCGYSARSLNWQCPSCHEWTSTRPISDLNRESLDRPQASALPR